MPLMDSPDRHEPKELFRYASVRPPRIIDLQSRAKRVPEVAEVLGAEGQSAASWARAFIESGRVVESTAKLRFPYFQHLKRKTLSPARLPSRADLVDPSAFAKVDVRGDPAYRQDWEAALLSVIALRIDGGAQSRRAEEAARILDFIETFPNLAQVTDPPRYAPAVLTRFQFRALNNEKSESDDPAPSAPTRADDMKALANDLALLWQARNRRVQAQREQFDRDFRAVSRETLEASASSEVVPVAKVKNGSKKALERRAAAERAKAYSVALRSRAATLRELKRAYAEQRRSDTLEAILSPGGANALARYVPGKTPEGLADIATSVRNTLGKYNLPWSKFCQAYEQAVSRSDVANPTPPTTTSVTDGCFAQSPQLVFADTVRILGRADLIRVDETFVKYFPGEISYVENMLAGETRERRVKTAKYFEQSTELTTDTLKEASKESSTSTQQELHTQIDTELQSRFQSDINASASGSGGGNIGVVSLQGSGNVGASLNLGVDSGLKTSNESKLSQEIVDKALERTRERIIEKRVTRSYTLDQTYNKHEIKNTIGTPKNRNGVYCFLNRQVAITYGSTLKIRLRSWRGASNRRVLVGGLRHRAVRAERDRGMRSIQPHKRLSKHDAEHEAGGAGRACYTEHQLSGGRAGGLGHAARQRGSGDGRQEYSWQPIKPAHPLTTHRDGKRLDRGSGRRDFEAVENFAPDNATSTQLGEPDRARPMTRVGTETHGVENGVGLAGQEKVATDTDGSLHWRHVPGCDRATQDELRAR